MPNSNTNDFNLSDDQIERLAEAIVEKLFIKQEEADAKFLADLKKELYNTAADLDLKLKMLKKQRDENNNTDDETN